MNKLFILAILAIASFPANAYDLVFDPTNFSKNTVTAAQTAQILVKQVQLAQLAIQNVVNLSPEAITARVLSQVPGAEASNDLYQTYGQLSRVLQQIQLSNNNLNQKFQLANRVSTVSGQSVSEMLATEIQMHNNGKQAATDFGNYFDSQAADILNYQRRADELSKRIPQNSGLLEGISTLGLQNAVITDQLSNLSAAANLQAKSLQQDKIQQETKNEYDAQARQNVQKTVDDYNQARGIK